MNRIIEGESYEQYLSWIEHFFEVNNISPERQVVEFIRLSGPKLFWTVSSINSFKDIRTAPYGEFKMRLEQHLTTQRCCFHQCVQTSNQSMEDFIYQLEICSQRCHFEEQFRQDYLFVELTCGVYSDQLRKLLIAEPRLNYKLARFIALNWEGGDEKFNKSPEAQNRWPASNSSDPVDLHGFLYCNILNLLNCFTNK